MLKVIALDPGVTTGYAEGVIEDGYMKVRCDEEKLDHLGMYDWLTMRKMDVIVCESFEFRKLQQGVNYYPVEMIGIIKLFVQQTQFDNNKVAFHMQPPATQGSKAYWSTMKLKEANVYAEGKEHGRSAMKHLLYWWEFGTGYQYNKKGFGPWDKQ